MPLGATDVVEEVFSDVRRGLVRAGKRLLEGLGVGLAHLQTHIGVHA
jgi:hypothetical protein